MLGNLFPEKKKQKFDKLKKDLKNRLGVDRFVITPITPVSQSEICAYDYAVGTPENPYTYKLAQVTVYGTCVVAGIEIIAIRNTFHDAQDSNENLSATLVSSMNYVEEILHNTLIVR